MQRSSVMSTPLQWPVHTAYHRTYWKKGKFLLILTLPNICDLSTGHHYLSRKNLRMASKKDVESGLYTIRRKVALQRTSGLVTVTAEALCGKDKCYPLIPLLRSYLSLDIPTTPNTPQHHKSMVEHDSLSRQPAYQDIAELLCRAY